MKLIVFLMMFVAAILAWSPTSIAQQQAAVGAGQIPLNATGVLNGVAMSASGITGTLTVGVLGGPATDIFTLNNPPVAGLIAVSTAANSQGNIVFNSGSTVFGAIGATQPGGPFLLNISGGNNGASVNFLGPVFATTLDVIGTGSVNFNSGSTNIVATSFAADGVISLAPNTTLIGALTTAAGANTGTLALGGGSTLDGAVGGGAGIRAINVVGGSNAAGVTASISGAANAFTFNLGTNTLEIGGALTIANAGPSGVINTTLAAPTVYGNIRPIGATNLGPTLLVNVTVPSTAFIPVGTQFNIVQTRTGTVQSGTNGSVVSVTVQNPTNPLYTFSALPPAGTIAGLVTITTTGTPLQVALAPPAGANLPPTAPIAAALAPVLAASTLSVLPAINALSDPGQVVNAIAQLAPSAPDVAAPYVTFQGSRQFQSLWTSRLHDILCGDARQPLDGSSACQEDRSRSGWWLKGFGHFGKQNARDSFVGYDSQIYGTMIGFDAPLASHTRAGLGLGYARSIIDGKMFDASTNANTYKLTAFLGHEPGNWFVYGDAGFGWNDYSGTRHVSFTGVDRTADADYDGQEYTTSITTGYHFLNRGFAITPLASLQYTHLRLDGYTETGAGDINLRVNSQSYNFLESGLGVKVGRPFYSQDMTYLPEIHFKWLHELNNPSLEKTAAFAVGGSPAFTAPGLRTNDDMFNVGAGLTLLSCRCSAKSWSVEGGYDYEWRSDHYSAHRGIIRIARRF